MVPRTISKESQTAIGIEERGRKVPSTFSSFHQILSKSQDGQSRSQFQASAPTQVSVTVEKTGLPGWAVRPSSLWSARRWFSWLPGVSQNET